MKVERTSPLTGKVNTMDLDVTQAQLDEMALPPSQRRMVQQIFPNLSAEEREFVKTGYTPEDWKQIFPDEEEDDVSEDEELARKQEGYERDIHIDSQGDAPDYRDGELG